MQEITMGQQNADSRKRASSAINRRVDAKRIGTHKPLHKSGDRVPPRLTPVGHAGTSHFIVGGGGIVRAVEEQSVLEGAKLHAEGAVKSHVERTPAPTKSRKQPRSRKAVCRNLRMCGSARVPKVTRSPHKLSAVERAEVDATGAANAVRKAFEAARRARAERIRGYAKNMPGLLRKQGPAMIKSTRGKRFFSANGAGIWLIARGLHEPVRHYNGFGGAMGGDGLKLPWFKFECRRYFDIGCVNMTEKQKTKRHVQVAQIGIDLLPALIAG